MKALAWIILRTLHHLDFKYLLPWIATRSLNQAWRWGAIRGWVNGQLGRDWRSMALGFRHIWRQTDLGYQIMYPHTTGSTRQIWRSQRYQAEAQDELDAQLIAHGRLNELQCEIEPDTKVYFSRTPGQGLLLLTPHYESFFAGVAFLAQASGEIVNLMSSAVTHDPRVDEAVKKHFTQKYRGLEPYLNGGRVLDMEVGVRSFYKMLEAGQTLVVLADAPVLPQGVSAEVPLAGGQRRIAGGALRMAHSTQSLIGAYWCEAVGVGQYQLHLCPPGDAQDPQTIVRLYEFMSNRLLQKPGGWWAVDLLSHMVIHDKT